MYLLVLFFILVIILYVVILRSQNNDTKVSNALPAEKVSLVKTKSKPAPSASMIAVGDIMLSREVERKMKQHGLGYPFEKVSDYLKSADFVFGNLEGPIIDGPEVPVDVLKFRAPEGVEKILFQNNIQILSLASNHIYNQGQAGIDKTVSLLDSVGIKYTGAGKDQADGQKPAIIEQNGLRIAFLAYTYPQDNLLLSVASLDKEKMKSAVENTKKVADLVIVSMHTGKEYSHEPTERQVEFAHSAIDSGADLVLGHHPHVIQPVEIYKNKNIFYSLGNFIFDQRGNERQETVAIKFLLEKGKISIRETKAGRIKDFSQPNFVTGDEAKLILDRLKL